MLNELCQLAAALDSAGIAPKEWHPQLKLLPKATDKKPCYRISIAENGAVNSLDTINENLITILRKWEPSNGNSFPGFNIQPLYRIIDEEQKKQLKAWRDGKQTVDVTLLKSWCNESNDNWDKKIAAKLVKCLKEIPQKLLGIINLEGLPDILALQTLIRRVIRFPHVMEEIDLIASYEKSFQEALEARLWTMIEQRESVKTALPVLVHAGSIDKNPKNDRGSVSVFLDISDWRNYSVASKDCIERVNIEMTKGRRIGDTSKSIDAFGNPALECEDKLPSVRLPIIADVKLRAMNSESSCQHRYRTINAISFPIGKESRKRVKGALEWLGDETREGETWGRADAKELLFAYPETLPKIPLKLASCFGAKKTDDTGARFANAARDVIRGLKGLSKDLNKMELRVFSLKKMDKARTKVVFHRNYTAQRLVVAAQEWERGCANIPEIHFRAWSGKKGEWVMVEPKIPFPLQVASCLNRVWKQDGTTECETHAVISAQGIELLLDEQPKRFVPHLLAVLLQNGKGLLLSLAHVQHKGEIISVINGYDAHKLLVPSILGLLLHKLGVRKESYMNNAPFLVGKMLKLADELHALYCKEMRDNKLPPQLVGNTLMTAALDSPVQALSQLALRIKPYYGWAQTFRGAESGKLVGYFIGLFGDTASQLAKLELPSRFNDAERAQLLLGYLAAHPKKGDTSLLENN